MIVRWLWMRGMGVVLHRGSSDVKVRGRQLEAGKGLRRGSTGIQRLRGSQRIQRCPHARWRNRKSSQVGGGVAREPERVIQIGRL